MKAQTEVVLKVSLHSDSNILTLSRANLAHLFGFRNDGVEPFPITWDELGTPARRSTCMEDEYQFGRGVVGP